MLCDRRGEASLIPAMLTESYDVRDTVVLRSIPTGHIFAIVQEMFITGFIILFYDTLSKTGYLLLILFYAPKYPRFVSTLLSMMFFIQGILGTSSC